MKLFCSEKREKTTSSAPTNLYSRLVNNDSSSDGEPVVFLSNTYYLDSSSRRLILFNVVLFIVSLCCLVLSTLVVTLRSPISGRGILKQTTFYSPPIDSLAPSWFVNQVVTHHLSSNESIFRQDPSPEVDAAWNRVSDLGVIGLTKEQLLHLGKDPTTSTKAPSSWGMGEAVYIAQFDGIHLMHCLNSIRKTLHQNFNYYYPRGIGTAFSAHLAHCQEALARWLMCQPSMELITFDWVEKHATPFPDFDITRKCWDFEQLLEWQDKHRVQSINTKMWKALRAPEGIELKSSPILNDEAQIRKPFNGTRDQAL
ncbi:hypothetical protein A9K55_001983 [Cordyceps militaris]|uniref:Tat pathway signal sequence n=1 Tax=Cordyceps militaris TaxID=73501 RepID=A0A2H4ST86_CORMI|nr:hypothetical protein A9K55_001983 [Cordyceps militaris]